MNKNPCPNCGQEIFSIEAVCPFCAKPVKLAEKAGPKSLPTPETISKAPVARDPEPDEPVDLRDRLAGIPLWAAFTVVAVSGLVTALVLVTVSKTPGRTDAGLAGLINQGPLIFPYIAGVSVFRWLEQTLVIWIGLRIMSMIVGELYDVGFVAGYRLFMPVTMLMTVADNVLMVVSFMMKTPLFMLAGLVNILIMKAFLELDWTEIIILNVVLLVLSCMTGGLL